MVFSLGLGAVDADPPAAAVDGQVVVDGQRGAGQADKIPLCKGDFPPGQISLMPGATSQRRCHWHW